MEREVACGYGFKVEKSATRLMTALYTLLPEFVCSAFGGA